MTISVSCLKILLFTSNSTIYLSTGFFFFLRLQWFSMELISFMDLEHTRKLLSCILLKFSVTLNWCFKKVLFNRRFLVCKKFLGYFFFYSHFTSGRHLSSFRESRNKKKDFSKRRLYIKSLVRLLFKSYQVCSYYGLRGYC